MSTHALGLVLGPLRTPQTSLFYPNAVDYDKTGQNTVAILSWSWPTCGRSGNRWPRPALEQLRSSSYYWLQRRDIGLAGGQRL